MSEVAAITWKPNEELAAGTGKGTVGSKLGVAENPDKVVRTKGLRVFEEMERKDAHYAAALQTRKLALLGKGYEIQPASDAPRDQEIAEFVRWNLEQMRGSFTQDLFEVLDAEGKGFSLSEIVYTLAERGPWRGKVILKAIKAKDQNFLGFVLDEYDNILDDGIVQNPLISHGLRMAETLSDRALDTLRTAQAQDLNKRLPRDKFLHFCFNGRAENPYGRGLGAVCYWYSWFKSEAGFKFWLRFLEKFGMPLVRATITAAASAADRERAREFLEAMQQDTGVIQPEGIELDLLEATRGGEGGYDKMISVCNAEISKAVLGQTLTTEQGDRGARALGEVHQEVLHDVLRFDAELLSAAISEQLVRRLVDFNFGNLDAYPLFVVPFKEKQDLTVFSQALLNLVQLGTRIPERYVHEETGIPMVEDDEPVLTSQRAPNPFDGQMLPFAERPITRSQLEPSSLKRRKREAQDELIEAGMATGRVVIEQILNGLIDQVRRGDFIAQRQYNADLRINILPLRRALVNTAVLANLTGRQLAADELDLKGVAFPDARYETFAEVGPSEIVGPEAAIRLFRGLVPIAKREWNRLLAAAKSKYFTVAGIEEANMLKLVQQALIEAIENGGTVEGFALAVREAGVQYTGVAYGQDLAGQALKDAHVRLLFRNNVMSAYNQGREAIFSDPDVEEYVPWLMYSAIDDDRVRPSHAAMDGRIYRKDDPIWQTWMPPNGHNCRCEVIPVTQPEGRRLRDDQIVTGPAVLEGQAVQPDTGFGGIK